MGHGPKAQLPWPALLSFVGFVAIFIVTNAMSKSFPYFELTESNIFENQNNKIKLLRKILQPFAQKKDPFIWGKGSNLEILLNVFCNDKTFVSHYF